MNRASLSLTLFLVIAGCVPSVHPQSEPTANATSSQGAAIAPGFYRRQNDPTVFKIGAGRTGCVVANEEQMALYGGFGKVRIVDPSTDLKGSIDGPVTWCDWPSGLYRLRGNGTVYRVVGDAACRLKNPTTDAVVHDVAPDARLTHSGAQIKDCR